MNRVGGGDYMKISSDQEDKTPVPSRPKGGLLTMPFIIANESLERVASSAPNIFFYLTEGYHMSNASGQSILQLSSAMANFSPIFGAFLSDSYLGRFQVIAMGSISSFLGVVLLWLTAMIPAAKPQTGESPNSGQLALLYSSFVLMAIGSGGIRPCSMAFGADQLKRKEDSPNYKRILQSYFSWYYASIGFSILISMTVIVYIPDRFGWKWGFGVPAVLMFLSVLSFLVGSSLYVKVDAGISLFTALAQVIVVSFKNRSLAHPPDGRYHFHKESNLGRPSENLRFLNKACIIRDPENDLNPDGSTSKPWNSCTVEQVEALKSIIRILPIWSTGIIMYAAVSLNSLALGQVQGMDRHLTPNFEIPAASIYVFTVITLTVGIAVYDRAVVPFLAKFAGQPRGLSYQVRMGIGLVLSSVAMVVAAMIEMVRRKSFQEGSADTPPGSLFQMSAFWLVPQLCLGGLAEAFNAIGQIEFYYSRLPKNMSSFAMALHSLGSGFAGLLASFLVNTVDGISKQGGKQSWVANDPNNGHYDYFYWFLAILCAANFMYFLLCCRAFGGKV
ncbi:hypothetical protein IFM89_029792 [Coptis chinensis]|uniref:Uncharacterized protein n=1 Tax=Coptis chinensis TaxID=261450 RepID=A0A835M2D7_9MAGN|nr:hypothetical protein IFM89_029792 [Coptis chinensis]